MHYLYVIRNLIDGKKYIGQTRDPRTRWNEHRRKAKKPNQVINFAMRKHGVENFAFTIIAQCLTADDANALEEQLIVQERSHLSEGGYNVNWGGMNIGGERHPSFGKPRSPETREKLRQANYRRGFVGDKHPWTGKKHTLESRRKMSEAHLRNKSTRKKMTWKPTDETRAIWSSQRKGKGRRFTEEEFVLILEDSKTMNCNQLARKWKCKRDTMTRYLNGEHYPVSEEVRASYARRSTLRFTEEEFVQILDESKSMTCAQLARKWKCKSETMRRYLEGKIYPIRSA